MNGLCRVAIAVGVVLSLGAIAGGCTTTHPIDERRAVVVGHVYDENGLPLSGIDVRSGRFRSVTDSFGRFKLESVPLGDRTISVEGALYETVTTEVSIVGPFAVAHIVLWSLTGLIDQAIVYLEAGTPTAAVGPYHRALGIAPTDRRVLLLGTILEDEL